MKGKSNRCGKTREGQYQRRPRQRNFQEGWKFNQSSLCTTSGVSNPDPNLCGLCPTNMVALRSTESSAKGGVKIKWKRYPLGLVIMR